jgi:molybdate transport system substrate-binding protein
MDYLAGKGLIRPATRVSFLANRLVLIAPAGSTARLSIGPRFPLARALGAGRLAMADPDSVPAGKYGKAALSSLGVWSALETRIARAENVRAALALVERGEAPFGIVYVTDAMASRTVRVLGTFPAASHPPITYPLATLRTSTHPATEAFRRFLLSREGKAIFARHGFAIR